MHVARPGPERNLSRSHSLLLKRRPAYVPIARTHALLEATWRSLINVTDINKESVTVIYAVLFSARLLSLLRHVKTCNTETVLLLNPATVRVSVSANTNRPQTTTVAEMWKPQKDISFVVGVFVWRQGRLLRLASPC